MDRRDARSFTLRLPPDEHELLRAYAFVTNKSLNETVVLALREFFKGRGREELFEKAIDKFRTQYRVALDKLADL